VNDLLFAYFKKKRFLIHGCLDMGSAGIIHRRSFSRLAATVRQYAPFCYQQHQLCTGDQNVSVVYLYVYEEVG
jgi:uncharacterized protein (UPF0276 family)